MITLHLSYLLDPTNLSNLSTQPYTHFLQLTYFLINKNKDFQRLKGTAINQAENLLTLKSLYLSVF